MRGVKEKRDEIVVGVIVPMFNAECTIAATLESICRQTHRKLDVVVIDDGSIDDSATIVESWRRRDNRIRIVRQRNEGVASARNQGAQETAAAYLAFVDADDLWAPPKIEIQLAVLNEAGPEVGLVYCWYVGIDTDGRVISLGPQPLEQGRTLPSLLADNWIGNGSSLLIRRQVFEEVGGYDATLHSAGAQGSEDTEICLRVAERSEFRIVPRYLVGYRLATDTMSDESLQMLRSIQIVLDRYRARYPEYAIDIRDHLGNARHWYAWRAVARGQMRDAAIIALGALAARPLGAVFRFCGETIVKLRGRLMHRHRRNSSFKPFYNDMIW